MRLPAALVGVWMLIGVFTAPRPLGDRTTVAAQNPSPTCASAELASVAESLAAAFDEHEFVFLDSTHGSANEAEFLLCLLSRPGLQRRVTDVFVEWANPVHQTLMDRYLLRLEPLPIEAMTPVWFDTDYPPLWARLPQIPQFFVAVRDINTRLPPERRLRVLGASEPVDWSTVRRPEDLAHCPYKSNWMTHVITEHFGREGRRLLVVVGAAHMHHNGGTVMADLDAAMDRSKLFVIGTIEGLGPDDREHVARLGDPAHPFFIGKERFPSSGPYPIALRYTGSEPLSAHLDAVLYLGPSRDRNLLNGIPFTAAQQAELDRRNAIIGDQKRTMMIRLGGRNSWFSSHPNDIPPRP